MIFHFLLGLACRHVFFLALNINDDSYLSILKKIQRFDDLNC